MGLIAGFYGGWVDTMVMRLADVIFAFPMFVFALLVSAVPGPGVVKA